ncbi:hypothetical protein [Methylobacterium sp. CM6257]
MLRQRSEGALAGTVHPNSSLMKTNSQFAALRKGALDLSLFPFAYAGGQMSRQRISRAPSPRWSRTSARATYWQPGRTSVRSSG